MTDIPRPAEGDTSWTDWADDVEATTDQIHAATDAATPSTLVKRDAAGRFKAVSGSAAADVVIKSQLDGKVDTTRTITTTAPLTGGGDLSVNRTLAVSAATDLAAGVVELATAAETTTGTDATRAVTPAGAKVELDKKAPTTRLISTTAPLAGGGDLSADRTLTVSAASETAAGVVELATAAETTTGTDAVRAVHPAGLKVELDKKMGLVDSSLKDAIKVTQATYDGLATPRPATRVYFIVG